MAKWPTTTNYTDWPSTNYTDWPSTNYTDWPNTTSWPSDFSPLSLSPALWLRSDLGITLNGSNVSAWADQSGNGNDFTQATPANQMAYNTSVASFANQPTLESISADTLARAGTLITGDFTVFIACRATAAASAGYVFAAASLGGFGLYGINSGNANKPGAYDGSNDRPCPTGYAPNTQTLILTYTRAGASITIRANGPTNTVTGSFTNANLTGITLCSTFVGHVSEYIVVNSALSATPRDAAEAYLASRYGVTLS